MELHNLKPAKGSTKNKKRIARGVGSGHGRTATRGMNGQKSRSGFKNKRAHQGGQMPLQMALPKRGFRNPTRVSYVGLNLDRLQAITEKHGLTEITLENLVEKGIVGKNDRVKILGGGELSGRLDVTVHAITASAKQAVVDKGGSVNLV